MDGSSLPSEMRYVLLNKDLADMIDDMDNEDLKLLLELIQTTRGCECGCRGRSHITITTDDGRRRRLSGRFRLPNREPAVPDFEQQFRV